MAVDNFIQHTQDFQQILNLDVWFMEQEISNFDNITDIQYKTGHPTQTVL